MSIEIFKMDTLRILKILEQRIQDNEYKGYDPYDVLNSPIFNLPLLKSNRFLRFSSQQVFRRLPVNFRPLFGIEKSVNPVTLGLAIQAYSYMSIIFSEKKQFYLIEINKCLDVLWENRSIGYSGTCWGYNFDWEARYAQIPKWVPTVVATGIITNSLYECFKLTGLNRAFDIIQDSPNFVLKDLNKTSLERGAICLSYSPLDYQRVLNASLKGARLLVQNASITGNSELNLIAGRIVDYVVQQQKTDGSWPYSVGDTRTWVDNFHTGYVLDSLCDYITITGDNKHKVSLNRGKEYYIQNFFFENKIPKYYHNKLYPIDSTALGQSLITLTNFNCTKLSINVAKWMICNFFQKNGSPYYRVHRFYRNRIPFKRWSDAWLFVGLAKFVLKIENN